MATALLAPVASRPQLISVRSAAPDLYTVLWRRGDLVCQSFVREDIVEVWHGDIDADLHRPSTWPGCVHKLTDVTWSMPDEAFGGHEPAELPRWLLPELTEIVLDGYRPRAVAVAVVR